VSLFNLHNDYNQWREFHGSRIDLDDGDQFSKLLINRGFICTKEENRISFQVNASCSVARTLSIKGGKMTKFLNTLFDVGEQSCFTNTVYGTDVLPVDVAPDVQSQYQPTTL